MSDKIHDLNDLLHIKMDELKQLKDLLSLRDA